jgi:pyruvate ferredoxin oxidoreductase beta subunit
MERYAVFVPKLLPREECFLPDAPVSCKGCGESMAVRQVYKVLGAELIKKGTWKIPWKQQVQELKGGEKADGFMPALLRIPKEGKQVLSVCFDNEARTEKGAVAKQFWEKRMPAVAVAEGIGYVATACPGYPFDLMEKVKKACSAPGDAYIHILCPCPVGWGFDSSLSVKIGKLAVESNLFPLYEVVRGICFMTIETPQPREVKDYMRLQERFKNYTDSDIQEIQNMLRVEYSRIKPRSTGEMRDHGHA